MSPGAIKAWVIQSAGKNRGFEDEDDDENEDDLVARMAGLLGHS
jgi:hypothetical protein